VRNGILIPLLVAIVAGTTAAAEPDPGTGPEAAPTDDFPASRPGGARRWSSLIRHHVQPLLAEPTTTIHI